MARRPKPWFRKSRRSWFVTLDGVQHNLGTTKKEAYERFYELMRQPQERRVSSHSMAAIADSFLDWVQKNRAADTYEWYHYRLQRFVQKYPDLRAADVRPYHVENWVADYSMSQTSRRNYLRAVKRCLKWAVVQGYLNRNPVEAMEVPAGEHKEVVISDTEYQQLLTYIRSPQLADLVKVTWESGCRPQESLRVEARHVDLANQRWVIPRSEAKMKRLVRVVYLTDPAFEITKRLVAENPVGPLFRNEDGQPWTTEAINCTFDRIRYRMAKDEMKRRNITISDAEIEAFIPTLSPTRVSKGEVVPKPRYDLRTEAKQKLIQRKSIGLVPRYSLYALRHSWATHALQRGVDPLTVAILMGHQDPSMLSKVYQHLSLNPSHMLDQARRAVG